MTDLMSHSQFHRLLLKLRHAWLNLWDKHMTTGRINQVTISRTLSERAWRLQRDCSHWLPLEFVTRRLFKPYFQIYTVIFAVMNLRSIKLWLPCSSTFLVLLNLAVFSETLKYSDRQLWWRLHSASALYKSTRFMYIFECLIIDWYRYQL